MSRKGMSHAEAARLGGLKLGALGKSAINAAKGGAVRAAQPGAMAEMGRGANERRRLQAEARRAAIAEREALPRSKFCGQCGMKMIQRGAEADVGDFCFRCPEHELRFQPETGGRLGHLPPSLRK